MNSKEEFLSQIFHIVFFNELLSGQSWEYIERVCREGETSLSFDFAHTYFCLTGLEKCIYTGRCGLKTQDYVDIFQEFQKGANAYFEKMHCMGEVAFTLYFNNKRICIAFSPLPACTTEPEEIARQLGAILQGLYNKDSRFDNYENNISLSPYIGDFKEIAPAFARLLEIHKQTWFIPEILLFTEETRKRYHRPMTRQEAETYTAKIKYALNENQSELCHSTLKELLLGRLKYTFDISLCWDVLHELKRVFLKYAETFAYPKELEQGEIFKPNLYYSIEECYKVVQSAFEELGRHLSAVGEPKSYLTLEALQYIRNSYAMDIAVTDIAKHLGIVPTYLSRIFNKDMHMGIPAYLNNLRMEKAKTLLVETDGKIGDIVLAVGICDRANFIRKFKQHTGLTPSEFRELQKEG